MEYSLSISFKDFSFRKKMTEFILETYQIKSIEYSKDFNWVKTNKQNVFELETDEVQFNLKDGGQLLIQNLNNSLPRIYGGKISLQIVSEINQFSENFLLDLIVDGQIHNYLDKGLQNTEELNYWEVFEREIPSYVDILPNPNYIEGAPGMDMIAKEFISIESLPGHSHQMNYDEKLWFGSCWQMYFSPTYYKYIPKFLFDDFQDCFEHKVFENGLRKITLFENPLDFDLVENRAKQWAFRKSLGIDSIAHELTKQNNRIEPKNLPIIISKQNCSKGTTRVEIKKGISITVKEFLDDGVTLVLEEIKTTV